jgi:hypothetical protein
MLNNVNKIDRKISHELFLQNYNLKNFFIIFGLIILQNKFQLGPQINKNLTPNQSQF